MYSIDWLILGAVLIVLILGFMLMGWLIHKAAWADTRRMLMQRGLTAEEADEYIDKSLQWKKNYSHRRASKKLNF